MLSSTMLHPREVGYMKRISHGEERKYRGPWTGRLLLGVLHHPGHAVPFFIFL